MAQLKSLFGWINQPFREPLDVGSVTLMTLTVLIVYFLWSRVLAHMHLE